LSTYKYNMFYYIANFTSDIVNEINHLIILRTKLLNLNAVLTTNWYLAVKTTI